MYKITILTSGKYHNVVKGARYCFFRVHAQKFINSLVENECEFELQKFVHCADGVFAWTEIFEELEKMLDKLPLV